MVGSLVLSYESAKNSRKKRTPEQTYGNRRLNIIAAFVNTVYIQCTVLFTFLETLHHMIEHWDFAAHSHKGSEDGHSHNLVSGNHDDVKHQAEIKLYISLFAIFRLAVFVTQIYQNKNL